VVEKAAFRGVMSEPKFSIPPGTLLGGKYKIGGILGAGGMGCVYKATNAEIGLKVAVKQEAKLAASIGHDNICEVIDFGTSGDGSPFLVMPRLKGRSLAEMMNEQETMSQALVADLMCQTLSALEAAHGENIVHRDLKPDNIFITKVGDRENFIKLLDFGISKIMDQDSVSNMTKTGTILGTPFYMAPEQAKGKKDIDSRTDIWAIGVIMYQALTGQKPFDGESYNEIMFKICDEPFPAPSEVHADVLPDIEEIVLRAMSRDPDGRFQSAEEMRLALEKVRDRITAPTGLSGVRSEMAFAETAVSVPPESRHAGVFKSKRTVYVILALVMLFVIGIVLLVASRKESAPTPVVIPAETASPKASPDAAPVKTEPATPARAEQAEPKGTADEPREPKEASASKAPKNKVEPRPGKGAVKKSIPRPGKKTSVKGRFNTEIDPDYE
jgi:serine/threonine protein kinase